MQEINKLRKEIYLTDLISRIICYRDEILIGQYHILKEMENDKDFLHRDKMHLAI